VLTVGAGSLADIRAAVIDGDATRRRLELTDHRESPRGAGGTRDDAARAGRAGGAGGASHVATGASGAGRAAGETARAGGTRGAGLPALALLALPFGLERIDLNRFVARRVLIRTRIARRRVDRDRFLTPRLAICLAEMIAIAAFPQISHSAASTAHSLRIGGETERGQERHSG